MAEFIYEPFADTEEYRRVNETIIQQWIHTIVEAGTKQIGRVLDLATGVGTMVQIFLDNLPDGWKQPAITCVDQSHEALEIAGERLRPRVASLELVQSSIEDMDVPENSVDLAMWGNGIHYLDEETQERALRNVRRALKPGGWFFFNSAFSAESRPPESMPFYRAQIANAVRTLRELGAKRDKQERPNASTFQDRDHYQLLLQRVGFAVRDLHKVAARLYKSAWENISGFSQYAAGALHGYRPDIAAKALREAVGPSLEQHGLRDENGNLYIPRDWLSAAARLDEGPRASQA